MYDKEKDSSSKLVNPAEIESFHKVGSDLTISVLSRFCGSRFHDMMTSSNGNIFRVPGHLCGEFTSPR